MIKYNKIYKKVKDVICYTMNKEEAKNALNQVYNHIENQDKEITQLREKLNEYNKDTEIQKLQNEIKNMRKNYLLILTDKEKKYIKEFSQKHHQSCNSNNIQYIVSPSSIGSSLSVQCLKCKEIEDITDYDSF